MIQALTLSLLPLAAPQCGQPDPFWVVRVGPTQAQTTVQGGLTAAQAIAQANPGVVPRVLVDPGTYVENVVFPPVDVVLQGDRFDPCGHVIDGSAAAAPVLSITSGQTAATRVEGFTLQNGSGAGGGLWGGGVYVVSASPTIQWNVIQDNAVGLAGGGAFLTGSSSFVADNVFRRNWSNGDGGGVCLDGSTARVESNRFVLEPADCLDWSVNFTNGCDFIGGAVACRQGDASVLVDNLIRGNRARSGAGIGVLQSAPTIEGNRILENGIWDSVDFGGGIHLDQAGGAVHSNVIAFNGVAGGETCAAPLEGGGIYALQSSTDIVNNTIWGNETLPDGFGDPAKGGGIAIVNCPLIFVINNVVWANQADVDAQVYEVFSLVGQSSNCVQGGGGPFDLPCTDPGLVDPDGLDFHLLWTSELRDAGETGTGYDQGNDFEGDPRTVAFGGPLVPDVGADEFATHVYHRGPTVTPTGPGEIRVAGQPGGTVGVWYAGLLLSPGFEVPTSPFGLPWRLGADNPAECDWQDLVVEQPVFFGYTDGLGPVYRTIPPDGYAVYAVPALPNPLACPVTLYLQSIVQTPFPSALVGTNVHELKLD